ncbi:phosphodiesterase [Novipirellula aureliae]|uniref:Phosphodiesterase n=1 Tax=Novipirellula aureliae TaxID=2527966 RepID=A0A5C6DY79_9BACT|nr:HDIG domain-containing metalloprotein [Novipirellula aureliae]TWU41640.1 phosphodiesterase [Novipirellula aureliae]
MSTSTKKRTRQERIESLGIPKPRFVQWWQRSDKSDFLLRIAMAVAAAVLMLVLCQAWQLPFAYRKGSILKRDLITRVTFQVPDEFETDALRRQKRREEPVLYRNRTKPLDQLRAILKDQLFLTLGAQSYEQMNDDERKAFEEFLRSKEQAVADDEMEETDSVKVAPEQQFAILKSVLATDPELIKVDEAVAMAMKPIYDHGLLRSMQHKPDQGNQRIIMVYPAGLPDEAVPVEASKVRIAQASSEFQSLLQEYFRSRFDLDQDQVAARMIGQWFVNRLPEYETLQYDDELSEQARLAAAARVEPVMTTYYAGDSKLATAGEPLTGKEIALLRMEEREFASRMGWRDKLARFTAYGGMMCALYLLCGSYIFFVEDRSLLLDRAKFAKMLVLIVATVVLCYYAARDEWRSELIPLVLASTVAAVVYGRELALLLMAAVCLSVTLFLGASISELVMLLAASTSCMLLLGRIRTRTHLLYVGAISAAITAITVVGVGVVTAETLSNVDEAAESTPFYNGPYFGSVVGGLCREALWAGFCILVSAASMTGLLPLVEKAFGVQTDLSLLELGDASHPLLRRLAQRAPGTYNHSINVASIAEAAADAIGANGLLVRVGAYFHDIGKMFKPDYFIENQSSGINQHDSLQPAMSTLVIIAHVKDGADLARSHHLPQSIIDFIMQHHGTTLVEYFYREAARRSEEDPNGDTVSDKDFRYPGPKPQTLEAAVMMLADTVESASRTLVDPTPSRIQGLVDAIAQKKMADGQFDECGLTFRQLDRIRASLVKSLTAIYHARVKYPGQQSA